MHFLSHIFLSLVLVVQGFFGHAQPPAVVTPTPTTTVSVVVSSSQIKAPTTKTPTVVAPANVPVSNSTPTPVIPPATTPTPVVTTANSPAPTPSPNTTLCNGISYSQCPTGESLVCPASGSAYCITPQQQAQQALEAQQQAVLTPLDNEISQLQTQSNTCVSEMTADTGDVTAQGLGAIASEELSAKCQNLSSELSVLLAEQNLLQQGGVMTLTCSQNIFSLEQQIYNLRQKALGEEGGDLTSGTSVVGQGNAQRDAQTETIQEAPLVQQVQQSLYYCQN